MRKSYFMSSTNRTANKLHKLTTQPNSTNIVAKLRKSLQAGSTFQSQKPASNCTMWLKLHYIHA